MFDISFSVEGNFDIDGFEVEVNCPKCQFIAAVTFQQVRIRDVVICRGCKSNVQLDDQLNSVNKTRKRMIASFEELKRTINW